MFQKKEKTRMNTVKLFIAYTIEEIQQEINSWLKENKDLVIIDAKLQMTAHPLTFSVLLVCEK